MKYLRSVGNGKIILNPIALLILLSVTCSSCQKKINVTPNSTNSDTLINRSSPVNQPQLIETEYQVVNNTRITLSSYVYAPSIAKSNVIGKLYPDTLIKRFFLSKSDSLNFYIKGDSLYLTSTGEYRLKTEGQLDVNLLFVDIIKKKKTLRILCDRFSHNKIIAHRGAWRALNYPYDSLVSLARAMSLGCEASEFDVWMTTDKVLVVNHDPTIGGMQIETSNYNDLINNVKLSNGEKLPTLKEYISLAMTQQITSLELEIKPSEISAGRRLEIADSVISVVHQLKAQAWTRYTCFDYNVLQKLKKDDVNARTAFINGTTIPYTPAVLKYMGIWGFTYSDSVLGTNPAQYISDAHKLGINTVISTTDNTTNFKYYLSINVDGIMTDNPELLLTLVK